MKLFAKLSLLFCLLTLLLPVFPAAAGNLPIQIEPASSTWDTVVADAKAQSTGAMSGGTPIYHSTKLEETTLEGDFTADANTTNLAILSDDGCDVTINGSKVLFAKDKGQALPDLSQSLSKLSATLTPGQTYHIKIDYSNVIYTGNADIDGCTLFAWGGSPPIVTVDTSGVSAANFNSRVAAQASGTLNASVTNAPQSSATYTVNAPTWSWSYGNVQYSADGKSFVSPPVSSSISINQPNPSSPAATFTATFNQIGYWAVAVTATVTYTSNRGSVSGSGADDVGSPISGQAVQSTTKIYYYQVGNTASPQAVTPTSRKAVSTGLSLMCNGNMVTSAPISVLVGQKINLAALLSTGNMQGPYIPVWTVSGDNTTRVTNYTQTVTSSQIMPLASPLYGNTTSFYWIAGTFGGTPQTVSCAVSFYKNYTANATFLVKAPTLQSFTSTTSTKGTIVGQDGFVDQPYGLSFGVFSDPGITWNATVSGATGSIAFVQLINNKTVLYKTTTSGVYSSSLGKYVADAAPSTAIYGNIVPVGSISDSDSPGYDLNPDLGSGRDTNGSTLADHGFTRIVQSKSFTTYLMYKPSGADSIFVTVGTLSWVWGATTLYNGITWLPPTNITPSNPDPATTTRPSGPTGSASSALPVWSNDVADLPQISFPPNPAP